MTLATIQYRSVGSMQRPQHQLQEQVDYAEAEAAESSIGGVNNTISSNIAGPQPIQFKRHYNIISTSLLLEPQNTTCEGEIMTPQPDYVQGTSTTDLHSNLHNTIGCQINQDTIGESLDTNSYALLSDQPGLFNTNKRIKYSYSSPSKFPCVFPAYSLSPGVSRSHPTTTVLPSSQMGQQEDQCSNTKTFLYKSAPSSFTTPMWWTTKQQKRNDNHLSKKGNTSEPICYICQNTYSLPTNITSRLDKRIRSCTTPIQSNTLLMYFPSKSTEEDDKCASLNNQRTQFARSVAVSTAAAAAAVGVRKKADLIPSVRAHVPTQSKEIRTSCTICDRSNVCPTCYVRCEVCHQECCKFCVEPISDEYNPNLLLVLTSSLLSSSSLSSDPYVCFDCFDTVQRTDYNTTDESMDLRTQPSHDDNKQRNDTYHEDIIDMDIE